MRYRTLGKTGLEVSEIGFGAEWIGKMDDAEVRAIAKAAVEGGVNIVDCWMSDPAVRSALGRAIEPDRNRWIIQGHIGSTWLDGQYVRTRDMDKVVPAFDDLLERLRTDHVELGMIHYVDDVEEFRAIMAGEFYAYVRQLLAEGKIEHIGLSTHNPDLAALHDEVPESVREHYRALDATASACIGCRSCEDRCPFGVAIADKMTVTAELFGF